MITYLTIEASTPIAVVHSHRKRHSNSNSSNAKSRSLDAAACPANDSLAWLGMFSTIRNSIILQEFNLLKLYRSVWILSEFLAQSMGALSCR